MTDATLLLPAIQPIATPDWLDRLRHLLAAHGRLARRRRLRGHGRSFGHCWALALPQSRHGG